MSTSAERARLKKHPKPLLIPQNSTLIRNSACSKTLTSSHVDGDVHGHLGAEVGVYSISVRKETLNPKKPTSLGFLNVIWLYKS